MITEPMIGLRRPVPGFPWTVTAILPTNFLNTVPKRSAGHPGLRGVSCSAGFSLVEMMIALTLGAFLILGLGEFLVANQRAVILEHGLSDMQQRNRFAMDRIRNDLYRAGYSGCSTGSIATVDLGGGARSPEPGPRSVISIYERNTDGTWKGADPSVAGLAWTRAFRSETERGARNGSAVLYLQTGKPLSPAGEPGKLLARTFSAASERMALKDNPGCEIKEHDRVAVTGCNPSVHAFRVAAPVACDSLRPMNPVELRLAPLHQGARTDTVYGTDSELVELDEVVWFVGDSGRKHRGKPIWALYRDSLADRRGAQEIVDGVEFLRLSLEHGSEGAPQGLVEVAMLLLSHDPVLSADDDSGYLLLDRKVLAPDAGLSGEPVHGGGPWLRQAFTSAVWLRNAGA